MVCCYDFVVAGGMRLYVVLKCGLKCRGGYRYVKCVSAKV